MNLLNSCQLRLMMVHVNHMKQWYNLYSLSISPHSLLCSINNCQWHQSFAKLDTVERDWTAPSSVHRE